MRCRPFVPLALLAALGGCAAALDAAPAVAARAPESGPVIETRIDPALQRALEADVALLVAEKDMPAMAVAMVRGDAIVASGEAGVRTVGAPGPVRPGDLFHVGSLAKPMTATMIATLVEEGRLRWEQTAGETFPEWREAMHPALRDATLQDFLSHRAGLAPFSSGSDYRAPGVPRAPGTPQAQRAAFVAWLLAQPPRSEPGGFVYSNVGYAVAAAFAERAAGASWEELMRARLFAPLGLESAGFGWPRAVGPDQPSGHWNRAGIRVPHGPEDGYELRPPAWPGGNIHMSIADLARFAGSHLAALEGRGGLVQAKTARRMQAPLGPEGYGLGWSVDAASFGEPRVHHSGATGIFRAHIWIFPERRLAFVAAANADTPEVAEAMSAIFQRLRNAAIAAEAE